MRILGDSKLKDVARKLNYSIGELEKEARILNLIKNLKIMNIKIKKDSLRSIDYLCQ